MVLTIVEQLRGIRFMRSLIQPMQVNAFFLFVYQTFFSSRSQLLFETPQTMHTPQENCQKPQDLCSMKISGLSTTTLNWML